MASLDHSVRQPAQAVVRGLSSLVIGCIVALSALVFAVAGS